MANTILEVIMSQFPNGALCRRGNSTFYAIPDEVIDGVQTYKSVKVGSLLHKATKSNEAFDFEAAKAEYAAFAANLAAKASKPKKSKELDPEKAAAREARRNGLMEYFKANPGVEFTSQALFEALPDVYEGQLIMAVGTDAKYLAEQNPEEFTVRVEKQKKHYTYNG